MRTASTPGTATPEQLLRRFRETRDPAAFGALYDATAPDLLRVALAIAPDAPSAENALQETFLAVLANPEIWDGERAVLPWLLGILHRQVGKVRRDAARTPDPLRVVPPLAPDDPATTAATRDEQQRVRDAIDELPEPYRSVALMRWRHGLDPADIANLRREPPGTTRSLLSRALEKLRERLGGGALALFGFPATKGIRGVRRVLMSKAAAATAAGTTVAVGGVLMMKKIVAACVVVVLLGGGTWWTVGRFAGPGGDTDVVAESSSGQPAAPAERKRMHAPDPAAAPTADDLPPPVDLDKCDRDLDLFGRVADEDGKPVAGAMVATARFPFRRLGVHAHSDYFVEETGPATRTARDGTFALRLTRGAEFELRVTAAGFAELIRDGCQAGERVTMTLRHGATLAVVCVDEAGAAVPGVRVTLWRSKQFDPLVQRREAVTDATGRAEFAGLIAGQATVQLRHPTLGEPGWQQPKIPASGVLDLRVTMPAGRLVRGRVTDSETQAPVAGASVGANWTLDRAVTTDADGRYAFVGWTGNGTSVLSAAATGFGSIWKTVPPDGDLDFVLVRGDRVIGRLVRADGSPVPGGFVGVHGSNAAEKAYDSLSARSGADGRFVVEGARRNMTHTLVAAAPGCGKTLVDFGPAAGARGTVDVGDVALAAPRSIEGVATDGDGRPLADRAISLAGSDTDRGRATLDVTPTSYRSYEQRRTDDLGRFRFPDLSPGTYELSIFCVDAPRTEPTRVVLPPDRDLAGVRVRMAGARSITLLVVDELGAPIDGMDVDAYGNFGQVGNSRHPLFGGTGPDGRVTFRGLPAGEVTFHVCNTLAEKRFLRQKVGPLVPDGQEVRVVLRRATEIRGVVRTEDGAVLPRMTIHAYLHRDGSEAGVGFGGEDGTFAIHVPADEPVDVRVEGWQSEEKDGRNRSFSTDWRAELTGVRGPADGVVLRARREKPAADGELFVVVQDSTGVPVAGVFVRGPNGELETDAAGRVHFENLPRGKAYVWASAADPSRSPRALDVPPRGAETVADGREVVLKFRAGVPLRGRVVDASGHGVANVLVGIQTDDYAHYTARCDGTGRFATAGIAGLAHKLTAGAILDSQAFSAVAEGVIPGDTEVTLTLAPAAKQPK